MTDHAQEVTRPARPFADVDNDLRFINRLIARMRRRGAAEEELAGLEQAVTAVRARRSDRSLYLAVVGEFSSGKTSFTNGLLGERLLRSSARPNTAAVTAIRHGRRRRLTVRFRDAPAELAYGSADFESALGHLGASYGDLRDTLELLCTDEHVAAAVERISLEHPSPMLGDGVVVLDTPGINSDNDAHAAVALETIQSQADWFVVLIPSTAPVSMVMQALLSGELKRHLRRTTVVITRMDDIPEEERESLIAFVRRRLQNQLGLAEVSVTGCAPAAALRAMLGDPDAGDEDDRWHEHFNALRDGLVTRLRHERAETVAGIVSELLEHAMEMSEQSLARHAKTLRQRAAELHGSVPEDLVGFCTSELHALQRPMDQLAAEARRGLQSAGEVALEKTLKQLEASLNKADTTKALGEALSGAAATVEQAMARVRAAVAQAEQQLVRACKRMVNELDERFESRFTTLDRLARRPFKPVAQETTEAALTKITAGALAIEHQLEKQLDQGMWGGAGVGAVVGTIILPGLGTLIGAGVGSMLVGLGIESGIARRRARCWTALEADVRAAFAAQLTTELERLDRKSAAARRHLEARVEGYHKRYAETMRDLITEHNAAERDLRKEIAATRRDAGSVAIRVRRLRERTPSDGPHRTTADSY
jgi:Dynamin family